MAQWIWKATGNEQIPRKTQLIKTDKEIENLKTQIHIKEIEYVIKNFPTKKTACPYGSNSKFFQTYNEKHLPSILKMLTWRTAKQKLEKNIVRKKHDRPIFLINKVSKNPKQSISVSYLVVT